MTIASRYGRVWYFMDSDDAMAHVNRLKFAFLFLCPELVEKRKSGPRNVLVGVEATKERLS